MTQDAPPAIDASPIVAAPEGWQMVPVEPTRQMIVAAEDELENQTDSDYDSDADGNRFPYSIRRPGWERAVYQAMLAAAPPVPEGKAEPAGWQWRSKGDGDRWRPMHEDATEADFQRDICDYRPVFALSTPVKP